MDSISVLLFESLKMFEKNIFTANTQSATAGGKNNLMGQNKKKVTHTSKL